MSKYLISGFILLVLITLKLGLAGEAVFENVNPAESEIYNVSFLNQSPIEDAKTIDEVIVTAYSSRPQETDGSPYTTAAGTTVRSGVVAANWLPLGTQIKIPEIFGNQVFTVEDRMHHRNSNKVDVWFESTQEALRFGVQKTRVEIL